MASSSAHPRPRHASSPFAARPEPVIEQFAVGERVCHDTHGLGRVISIDGTGATVDFGSKTVRVETPFRKMSKL